MTKPIDMSAGRHELTPERLKRLHDYGVRQKVEQSCSFVLRSIQEWAARLPKPQVMGKNGTAWLPSDLLALRKIYLSGQLLLLEADKVWVCTNGTYACESSSGEVKGSFDLLPTPQTANGWVTGFPEDLAGAALQLLEVQLPQVVRAMALFQRPKEFVDKT